MSSFVQKKKGGAGEFSDDGVGLAFGELKAPNPKDVLAAADRALAEEQKMKQKKAKEPRRTSCCWIGR